MNELDDLYQQKKEVEEKIREQKKAEAKERGDIVNSIDELACERHPESKILESEGIQGSFIKEQNTGKIRKLNTYTCKTCDKEFPIPEVKAYECPDCGIVTGEFATIEYSSPEESWTSLAGREGEHYHCRICDIKIGHMYWKIS